MLDDAPRKLLRIMSNLSNRGRAMPSVRELQRLSGRREADVLSGLRKLQEAGYIEWDGRSLDGAKVIKGEEERRRRRGYTDYWTQH